MRYNINYVNKGGSNTDNFEVLAETPLMLEKNEFYDYKAEYKKNNVVPNEKGEVGIVLNKSNGGFELTDYAREKLGIDPDEGITRSNSYNSELSDYEPDQIDRFNPALVKLVEDENENGNISGDYSNLVVEYIPYEYYQPYVYDSEFFGDFFELSKNCDGYEDIRLFTVEMNIAKLLQKIRDMVNSDEKSSDEKIQIIHDILNIPDDRYTLYKIVEHSKYVTNFGEEYFKAKTNFEETY